MRNGDRKINIAAGDENCPADGLMNDFRKKIRRKKCLSTKY